MVVFTKESSSSGSTWRRTASNHLVVAVVWRGVTVNTSMSLPRRGWARREGAVRRSIRNSRSMGSAALAIAYLANGRFDAFVQTGGLSAWDICAPGLIAIEGGVTLTTLVGEPWFDIDRPNRSIGLLGAAPAHHQTLLELLK